MLSLFPSICWCELVVLYRLTSSGIINKAKPPDATVTAMREMVQFTDCISASHPKGRPAPLVQVCSVEVCVTLCHPGVWRQRVHSVFLFSWAHRLQRYSLTSPRLAAPFINHLLFPSSPSPSIAFYVPSLPLSSLVELLLLIFISLSLCPLLHLLLVDYLIISVLSLDIKKICTWCSLWHFQTMNPLAPSCLTPPHRL